MSYSILNSFFQSLLLAHTHCALSLEVTIVAHVDAVAVVDYNDMVAIVDDREDVIEAAAITVVPTDTDVNANANF